MTEQTIGTYLVESENKKRAGEESSFPLKLFCRLVNLVTSD